MNLKSFLIVVSLVLTLIACSLKPEDKFIGKWESVSDGKLLMVPIKCNISLQISKNSKSNTYILDNLNVVLNPAVFGLKGGELFKNVTLLNKDETDFIIPKSKNSEQVTITLKNNNEIILVPNPCAGIASETSLKKY